MSSHNTSLPQYLSLQSFSLLGPVPCWDYDFDASQFLYANGDLYAAHRLARPFRRDASCQAAALFERPTERYERRQSGIANEESTNIIPSISSRWCGHLHADGRHHVHHVAAKDRLLAVQLLRAVQLASVRPRLRRSANAGGNHFLSKSMLCASADWSYMWQQERQQSPR